MGRVRRGAVAVVLVVVAGSFVAAPPASAAVITVTSEADVDTPSVGECTLREAIRNANANAQLVEGEGECEAGSGDDTIVVPEGFYQIDSFFGDSEDAGVNGDFDISSNITINGAGAGLTTIDGGGWDRVFHITAPSGAVTINGVTIQNGLKNVPNNSLCGGGGIANFGGTLTVNDSVMTSNEAGKGGGLFQRGGTTTLNNVVIDSNSAVKVGGGIATEGGATLNINGGVVTNNVHSGGNLTDPPCQFDTAFGGGGLFADDGSTIDLSDSTVSGNEAATSGGGVYVQNATLEVERSVIDSNVATGLSGGLINANDAETTIVNSTVSGNTGDGVTNNSNGSLLRIESVTTSANGTGLRNISGTTNVENSIIDDGCSGPVTSFGRNIDAANTCAFAGDGDLPNSDPQLEALGDNGGPTRTHRLFGTSPAIDSGSCGGLTVDQRGLPRQSAPDCDRGAYEAQPPAAAIDFPADGVAYNETAFRAGCVANFGDACGTAAPSHTDGNDVALVEVQIRRASDGHYWDGAAFQPAPAPTDWLDANDTSPWNYPDFPPPDQDGIYELSARATDLDGYVESTATVQFTIDNVAPAAPTIDAKSISARRNRARFTFSGEPGGTFECRRDKKAFAPCTSPITYKRLKDGPHRFEVRQIDAAGNVGAVRSVPFRV